MAGWAGMETLKALKTLKELFQGLRVLKVSAPGHSYGCRVPYLPRSTSTTGVSTRSVIPQMNRSASSEYPGTVRLVPPTVSVIVW